MGLRGQLALLIPGMVALALILFSVVELRSEQQEELIEFRQRNEKVLDAIGVTVAMMVAQNDVSGLDTLVAHLSESMRERELLDLSVVDDEGRVLAHTQPEKFNERLTDAFTTSAIAAVGPTWALEDDRYSISVPAVSGIRWATVTAHYSLTRLHAQFQRSRVRFIGAAVGIFVLLATILTFGLERLVLKPMRALQYAVRRMGEGHLSTRVPDLKQAEFSELGQYVNSMASALENERQNLERVVADRTKELQEANARLERLAVTDGLTGLFNHRRFQETLQAELIRSQRHKRPMGVLMVDVDFFKKVNDALGHPAGDELLRTLAGVLGKDLRQTDLIARYGGEEFAVILPETTKNEALQVGERMRAAVEERMNGGTPWPVRVTVSIGVASFPDDGATPEELLLAADQSMYVAKRQGRNRVVAARGVG